MIDQTGFHLLGLERGGAIRLAACTGSMYVAMFTEKGQHSVEKSYNYICRYPCLLVDQN